MIPIKFDLRQLEDLSEDLKRSPKALGVIIQRVLSLQLRQLRREMAPRVPQGITGRLRKSFFSSVRRKKATPGTILATFGFKAAGVSAGTIIAGNVLQKGSATARKSPYMWIPLPGNRNVTPRDFFNAEDTFIRMSKTGNRIAFLRTGDTAIPLFVLKHTVRLSAPPLPIEQRVEGQLPEITQEIQETIGAVIEARKKVFETLNG